MGFGVCTHGDGNANKDSRRGAGVVGIEDSDDTDATRGVDWPKFSREADGPLGRIAGADGRGGGSGS